MTPFVGKHQIYLERYGEPKTIKELEEYLGVSYLWGNGARNRP
jgi:hypothetical protein